MTLSFPDVIFNFRMVLAGFGFFFHMASLLFLLLSSPSSLCVKCILHKRKSDQQSQKKNRSKTNETVNNRCACVNGDTKESFNTL